MSSGQTAQGLGSVPNPIHIDAKGQVTDPSSHQRLDLTQSQFSPIKEAMSTQKSWDEGDYRLENGRLVSTGGTRT